MAYDQLISTLDRGGARYRFIGHAPEGRTEVVSRYRGHALNSAAKCIVVQVKASKKLSRYVLAVVPGDARVDLGAVTALVGGKSAGFASTAKAEALAGCVSGTIMPFSFHPDLDLVADPALLVHSEIFFNAARLDLSVALNTADYIRLARPRTHAIAAPALVPV
jgi:Ala-tRNA(Pro) deacylase